MHPLVGLILHGDVEEVPWDRIFENKDLERECLAVDLDAEIYWRNSIAATVQDWFERSGQ